MASPMKYADLGSDVASTRDVDNESVSGISDGNTIVPVSGSTTVLACSHDDNVRKVWGALHGRVGTVQGWSNVGVRMTLMFAAIVPELDEGSADQTLQSVGSRLARVFERELRSIDGSRALCHGADGAEAGPANISAWTRIQTWPDITVSCPVKQASDDDEDDVSTQDADSASVSGASASAESSTPSECWDILDGLPCTDQGWRKVGVQMALLFSSLASETDDENVVHEPSPRRPPPPRIGFE